MTKPGTGPHFPYEGITFLLLENADLSRVLS